MRVYCIVDPSLTLWYMLVPGGSEVVDAIHIAPGEAGG